ncbi:MAG TPA: DsbA family oxidoreductase [Polyangiaceae bacterium]
MAPLRIDVVSDIVCPWCYIGTRRLEQAIDSLDGAGSAEAPLVAYHPFLLDPSIPAAGVDLREQLRRKYGGDPEAMFARVEAAARETGIPLDFAKVQRMVSTVGAHTLLRHAAARGTQRALADALFEAYFLDGRDIGQATVLAVLAERQGFSADEALRLIGDEKERRRTREDAEESEQRGVEGVPFFMFGDRLALSGAQPLKVFRSTIERARNEVTS